VFGLCVTFAALDDTIKELRMLLYLDNTYSTTPKKFMFNDPENTHTSVVGAKVVIHPPRSFPDIWLGSQNVYAGHDASFLLEGTKWSVLGAPYGHCIPTMHNDLEVNPSVPVNKHGYECYRMCARDRIKQYCGCIHIHYVTNPYERQTTPLCGHIDEHNVQLTLNRLQCADQIMRQLDAVMEVECACPNPCSQFTYDHTANSVPWPDKVYHLSFYEDYIRSKPFQPKFQGYEDLIAIGQNDPVEAGKMIAELNLIGKNFAQVRILNHQNSYFHYKETPLVSREALFGNVGGLMNLWVGITFIVIIEIIDAIYQLVTRKKNQPQPV
jgi:hypothetical protein